MHCYRYRVSGVCFTYYSHCLIHCIYISSNILYIVSNVYTFTVVFYINNNNNNNNIEIIITMIII